MASQSAIAARATTPPRTDESTPTLPVTNHALGAPESLTNTLLETGASLLQDLSPPRRICAHLHAWHVVARDRTRVSPAHHYCAHVNDEVRQCLLYDSAAADARLIGVEYMITPRLFETLDAEERKLWHSHVFEVKSGMLIMPTLRGVPDGLWGVAEHKEMEAVVRLYGKVWQLWQTDRGDRVPLGRPELMMSFTAEDQLPSDFDQVMNGRDAGFGVDRKHKAESRRDIAEPEVHPDADSIWSEGRLKGKGAGANHGKSEESVQA